jgi:hypothetical protein
MMVGVMPMDDDHTNGADLAILPPESMVPDHTHTHQHTHAPQAVEVYPMNPHSPYDPMNPNAAMATAMTLSHHPHQL